MTAVYLPEAPPVIAEWLAERARQGLDRHDEVWEGVLHVAPHATSGHGYLESEVTGVLRRLAKPLGLFAAGSFNLGTPTDHRIPDGSVHREKPGPLYLDTAALVVEILSPSDETFKKFDFYAAHGVDELWVVDGATRTVRIWQLDGDAYAETGSSALLATTGAEVAAEIDWP